MAADADGFVTVTRRRGGKRLPRGARKAADAELLGPGSSAPVVGAATKETALRRVAALRESVRSSDFYSSLASALANGKDAFRDHAEGALGAGGGKVEDGLDGGRWPVALRLPRHVVCYGIGNFGDSSNAAAQMACLLELMDASTEPCTVTVFDPVLSKVRLASLHGCALLLTISGS